MIFFCKLLVLTIARDNLKRSPPHKLHKWIYRSVVPRWFSQNSGNDLQKTSLFGGAASPTLWQEHLVEERIAFSPCTYGMWNGDFKKILREQFNERLTLGNICRAYSHIRCILWATWVTCIMCHAIIEVTKIFPSQDHVRSHVLFKQQNFIWGTFPY